MRSGLAPRLCVVSRPSLFGFFWLSSWACAALGAQVSGRVSVCSTLLRKCLGVRVCGGVRVWCDCGCVGPGGVFWCMLV